MGHNATAFTCPQSTVDKLEKEKMPRKGGRWWFSWRRRDFPVEEVGAHGLEPGQGPRQGRRQAPLMAVPPTAQCPEGENHRQGARGVSRTSSWLWLALEMMAWGGAGRGALGGEEGKVVSGASTHFPSQSSHHSQSTFMP